MCHRQGKQARSKYRSGLLLVVQLIKTSYGKHFIRKMKPKQNVRVELELELEHKLARQSLNKSITWKINKAYRHMQCTLLHYSSVQSQ